ncbi:MAG: tRNA 2-thiouridine(34) synthase MnmA [Pseudomonadota bacterium]
MTLNSLDIAKKPEDTRVVVAMSGGVDSSVVAGILARQGYEVIGITLQLYDYGAAARKTGTCCAGQDIDDAQRVCEELGIPHYVLDYESRFREAVIDAFADSYIAGETPVPCISCNQTVKFADLLKTARDLDADCLATGHYIASAIDEKTGHRKLLRPADANRDQSYFLFATTQQQVDFLRFPLGHLTKDEVREIAGDMGLVVADKPDSQDICFVPEGKYADVIAKLRPTAGLAGDIVHIDGRVLGQHEGILHYTIGQRRGLNVSVGEPLYVVKIDARTRRVIVGPREALDTHFVKLREFNWLGSIGVDDISEPMDVLARVRSTRPPKPARISQHDGGITVELIGGEEGVSPGQACVIYDGEGAGSRVLGGGFIDATKRTPETELQLAALNEAAKETAL